MKIIPKNFTVVLKNINYQSYLHLSKGYTWKIANQMDKELENLGPVVQSLIKLILG